MSLFFFLQRLPTPLFFFVSSWNVRVRVSALLERGSNFFYQSPAPMIYESFKGR